MRFFTVLWLLFLSAGARGGEPQAGDPPKLPASLNEILTAKQNAQFANWVNPFIGTSGEGYTFPGPVLPWGMAAVSPHTTYTTPLGYKLGQVIAPSGYRYGQPKINGFGQNHLSGVGCPALGAPVVAVKSGGLGLLSYDSSYSAEEAMPGYYSVMLDKFKTKVELTTTKRVGVHRFTFPKDAESHILIDAATNLSWASKRGHIAIVSDTEVVGWSNVGNFCFQGDKSKVYFAAKLNKKPKKVGTWSGIFKSSQTTKTGNVGAWFTYAGVESVELYVGISYTSVENALTNLRAETADKDFEQMAVEAISEWEKQLGKIALQTTLDKEKTIFYTALYHALIHPNVISDISGDHPYYLKPGIGRTLTAQRYGVFSLWDTYRSLHSLLSLVYPKEQQEMLSSLEAMSLEGQHPPQWELLGKEVNPMVGDPALSVLAEGYAKGFNFKDIHSLFDVLYDGATSLHDQGRRPGNKTYQEIGYTPHKSEGVWGAVSTTLEYSYHDWSLAQLANRLGKEQAAAKLLQLSAGWEKLFDEDTLTLRPKDSLGQWLEPFNPFALVGDKFMRLGGPGYVEGNAYHYSYMLPHGVDRLMELHGGEDKFAKNLQSVFDRKEFVMWNEPDLIYPYLFTYTQNSSHLAMPAITKAQNNFFSNTPQGLPGNDDSGALSSWYVFSALGFYPANPVSGQYQMGLPLFEKATIQLDQYDSVLEIVKANNPIAKNSVKVFFNEKETDRSLTHAELIRGGTLKFVFQ